MPDLMGIDLADPNFYALARHKGSLHTCERFIRLFPFAKLPLHIKQLLILSIREPKIDRQSAQTVLGALPDEGALEFRNAGEHCQDHAS